MGKKVYSNKQENIFLFKQENKSFAIQKNIIYTYI